MGRFTSGWGQAARSGVPGVVVGLALAWAIGGGWSATLGAQPAPAAKAEATGTIAFTTATPGSAQLLYLIDTRAQAFAVYRVDPQKGGVKLEAARPYRWDLKLEYNNLPPEVGAVEAMVTSPAMNPRH